MLHQLLSILTVHLRDGVQNKGRQPTACGLNPAWECGASVAFSSGASAVVTFPCPCGEKHWLQARHCPCAVVGRSISCSRVLVPTCLWPKLGHNLFFNTWKKKKKSQNQNQIFVFLRGPYIEGFFLHCMRIKVYLETVAGTERHDSKNKNKKSFAICSIGGCLPFVR